MLHDRQSRVAKRKHLWLPRIRVAPTEAAQAIQFVKGRFFDRIRAFADSLNPPALKSDDNGADREPLLNREDEPPWNRLGCGSGLGGCEGSGNGTARCVKVDGACGAGGNKVDYKEN